MNVTADFDKKFDSRDYKRSRKAYAMECTFEYMVTLFITDAFLVNLLKHIGLDDSLIGVISSLVSLAFLFQFFSVFVVSKIKNTKKFVTLFHTMSQIVFMCLYLLPFLPIPLPYKKVLVVSGVLLAYFGNYFVTSIIFKWGNSFVHPRHRADFTAIKEMISLACGIFMTLGVGFVVDKFEADGNFAGGFIFCASGILIFCICDFICLMCIKNDVKNTSDEVEEEVPLLEVLHNIFGNRNFINVLIVSVLWKVGLYLTVGFLGTYRLGELGYTVLLVQIINIFGNFCRMFTSRIFGRFSDKYSFARGIEVGFIFSAAAFLCVVFTTPSSRFMIILYTAFYNISNAGLGGNMLNITYSCVNAEYFVQATAIKNSISGVLGFCATLAGSKVVSAASGGVYDIFGLSFYPQQIVGLISFVVLLGAALFSHFVLAKQDRLIQ